jgi:hypothetical protein
MDSFSKPRDSTPCCSVENGLIAGGCRMHCMSCLPGTDQV